MRTCIATVSLGGSLEDKIDGIAAAGFDGLELLDDDLRRSSMTPRDVALRCADQGLEITLYQPFRRAEGVTKREFADVLTRFHLELDIMEQIGCESILVVSNTDPDADASLELSATQLAQLGGAAEEHGIRVMFEALAWGTHINTVRTAWNAIQSADHANVSLVVDTFHMLARGESVDVLDELPYGGVGFVQVADAPWLDMDLIQWSRNHRCFPGMGELDLIGPVATMLASGYDEPLSLEIFNPGYRERPAAEIAQLGAESLRNLIEELTVGATAR